MDNRRYKYILFKTYFPVCSKLMLSRIYLIIFIYFLVTLQIYKYNVFLLFENFLIKIALIHIIDKIINII